jgi:hypothetical protein
MTILSVLALLLVAVTMGLSLAHALEFPGKLRLNEPTYRAVQGIYYPGFTIGGLVGEFGSLLMLLILLLVTPMGSERYWWTAAAFGFLVLGHVTYWTFTHPVNRAWLKNTKVSSVGSFFFGSFAAREADWSEMRNIWEYSHIARACFFMLALVSMTLALVRQSATA